MSRAPSNSVLFHDVVNVTHVYLGPAADRFIIRQIRNHLGKMPEELEPDDLIRLIDWIRVAVSFLTDDSELITEYIDELSKLAGDATAGDHP